MRPGTIFSAKGTSAADPILMLPPQFPVSLSKI